MEVIVKGNENELSGWTKSELADDDRAWDGVKREREEYSSDGEWYSIVITADARAVTGTWKKKLEKERKRGLYKAMWCDGVSGSGSEWTEVRCGEETLEN